MARPKIEGTKDQWERVAARVRERREDIPLTHQGAVDAVGAGSVSTWSAVERSERDGYTRTSLVTICKALGWTNDSIERILAGLEPVEVEIPDLARRVTLIENRLEEMQEVLEQLRDSLD